MTAQDVAACQLARGGTGRRPPPRARLGRVGGAERGRVEVGDLQWCCAPGPGTPPQPPHAATDGDEREPGYRDGGHPRRHGRLNNSSLRLNAPTGNNPVARVRKVPAYREGAIGHGSSRPPHRQAEQTVLQLRSNRWRLPREVPRITKARNAGRSNESDLNSCRPEHRVGSVASQRRPTLGGS
jgi:hypothetical protein